MPRLLGYTPDFDPRTEGGIFSGNGFVPTFRGIAGAPSPSDVGIAALSATCIGAVSALILSGGKRIIAGTVATLQELSGTTWIDRSKAGGYSSGGGRWRFTQYGDVTLATNRNDPIQASNPGVAFADLAGNPPKARYIDTVGLFVVTADTTEATFGDQPDRWWCSGLGNHTTWTPSLSTQAASGRILDDEGQITGSRGLGNSWIIYKKNAIYVGTYVGGDVIWAFEKVPGQVGCVSHDSIIDIQSAHIFRGDDDFYIFDGNRARPIGRPLKETFASMISRSFGTRILSLHDKKNSLIYFFYPSTSSSGQPDSGLVYNYESDKWGAYNISIQAVVDFVGGQLTWDQLGNIANTWNDFPLIAWDDPFWVSGSEAPAIFDTANKLKPLSGEPINASMETWEIGTIGRYTGISRVLPRFRKTIPSGTMIGMSRVRSEDGFRNSSPIAIQNGRFSYVKSGILHKFLLSFNGAFEMLDLDIEAKQESYE